MSNDLVPPPDLADLAAKINDAHQQAMTAAQSTVQHSREAGERLLKAKDKVPHGQWLAWLEANVEVTPRAAQGYMKLAREWTTLEANAKHVSLLTYREALAILADPRQEDADAEEDDAEEDDEDFESAAGHKPIEQLPEAYRHASAAKWWDILASYTLAQDARGWSPERIAAFWGRPVEEIRSILSPRPPTRFTTPDQGSCYFGPAPFQHAVEEAYRESVARHSARIIGVQYHNAAYHAMSEGWEDVQAEMEALARREDRRRPDLYYNDPLFALAWDDENLGIAVEFCAWSDARDAIAIEPAPESFLEMLHGFLEPARLA